MITNYKCLSKQEFVGKGGYKILPVRKEDIQAIREWRNSQVEVLRQKRPLTEQEQVSYYDRVVFPERLLDHPPQILFSLLLNDQLIGYGGLTHIDWIDQHAEVSFLLSNERAKDVSFYQQDFTNYLDLLAEVAFSEMQFHRLFAETYSFRAEHMRCLEARGYIREGAMKEHIIKKGEWFDSVIHGLLAKEWKRAQ